MMLVDFWKKSPKKGPGVGPFRADSKASKKGTTRHVWLIEGGYSSWWQLSLLVLSMHWNLTFTGHYIDITKNYQQKQGSHIVASKIVLKDNASEMTIARTPKMTTTTIAYPFAGGMEKIIAESTWEFSGEKGRSEDADIASTH